MEEKEEYLVHYGVQGMKWGIRRKKQELVDLQTALRKRRMEQAAYYRTDQYKKASKKVKKQAKLDAKAANEKRTASIKAKQEELKNLIRDLNKTKANIALNKRNFQRQKQMASLIMKKRGTKKSRIS